MRSTYKYSLKRREIKVVVPREYTFPHKLFRVLKQEGFITDPLIGVSGWRKKSLTLTLAEHEGLPTSNLLERLADWVSQVPGYLTAYDPWKRRGEGPVDMDFAVQTLLETILIFDENKLTITA